jgi:filamentous hemagglutinin family protein
MIRMTKAPQMRLLFLCPALLAVAVNAAANPIGESVVSGSVSMARPDARTLNITNSPGAIINWQGFSIGATEVTRFNQQSASSAVLNRVVGQDLSSIAGTLSSNGRVFLVNPNGALFTASAQINTAAFTFSTADIANADFIAGNTAWSGSGTFLTVEGALSGGQLSMTPLRIEVPGSVSAPGALTLNVPVNGTLDVSGSINAGSLNVNAPGLAGPIGPIGPVGGVPGILQPTIINVSTNPELISASGTISIGGNITPPPDAGTPLQSGGAITVTGDTPATTAPPTLTNNAAPVVAGKISVQSGSLAAASATLRVATSTGANMGAGSAVNVVSPSPAPVSAPAAVISTSSIASARPAAVATISLQKREPLF